MVLTSSTMFPLQQKASNFSLFEPLSKTTKTLEDCRGQHGTVVMFICNHCPFVVHVLSGIVAMANDYLPQGIGFAAISSNDILSHPQDAPEKMADLAREQHFPFVYLYDESQEVAKRYDAACTPDFYLFDAALRCVYRGQMDSARPGNNLPVTGEDLRVAMDNLLDGQPISTEQQPSMGCNIKWRT